MKKFLHFILFIFLLVSIVGCSKEDSSESSGIFSNVFSFFKSEKKCFFKQVPFVKKITTDSPVFVAWDTTNSEYKELVQKHPVFFGNSTIKNLTKNDKNIQKSIKLLEKIFNTKQLSASSIISKGVLFFEEIKEGSFPMAIYMEMENAIDRDMFYNTLKELAKENMMKISDIKIGQESGVSVSFENSKDNIIMNFLSQGKQIAISNRTYLLEQFLSKDFDSKYVENLFKENDAFKKSYKKAMQDNAITILSASLMLNSKFLPDKKVQAELSKLPIKNIIMNQSIVDKKILLNKFASSYESKTKEQEKIRSILKNISNTNAPFILPTDSILSLTLNMDLIKSLLEVFKKDDIIKDLRSVMEMHSFNIIFQSPKGTMFPNVALLGTNVKDSKSVIDNLKKIITGRKTESFLAMNKWQTKKIGNLDTEYMVTPLGVGIFITKDGDNLFVASSENLLQELLQDTSKKVAKTMREKFNTNKNDIVNIYFNPKFLASTLRSLNSTLSTFMPSNTSKINDTIEILENTPESMLDTFYEDDTFIGETKVIFE